MKNFILAVFIICITSLTYSQPTINPAYTPVLTTEFNAVSYSFINSLTGFVVDNRPYTPSNYNYRKTTDGGATWTNVLMTGNRGQMYFLNQLTGFVTSAPSKTTNGGDNWISMGVTTEARQITFINDTVGFFFNSGYQINTNLTNQIYRTTNGGNNWTVILQGYHPNSIQFNKLEFINANTGYAFGTASHYYLDPKSIYRWVYDSVEVLKTTNGGANWIKKFIPQTYITSYFSSLGPVKFFNENTGYLQTSSGNHQYILKTTNGGTNWTMKKDLLNTYIGDWQFLDSNSVWAYNTYSIFKTSDAFTNYTKENIYDTTDTYESAVMLPNGTAYIYSSKWKKLYRTNPSFAPVELSSFISSINKRNVVLNWSTVNEENNSGFNIEKKLSKSNEWNTIGNVPGNGTTNSPSNYFFTDKNLSTGKYNYRLKQIDFNGNFKYYDLANEVIIGVPVKFAMSQNYPNPFNPSTKINYDLPFDSKVSIKIFYVTGIEVASLINQVQVAGYYSVNFNASSLASGIYFYSINAEGGNNSFAKSMKMILVK